MTANDFEKSKELAAWKNTMKEEWIPSKCLPYNFEKPTESHYHSGHDYRAEIALDIKNIPRDNVGVEFVFTFLNKNGEYEFVDSQEFKLVSSKNGKCLYRLTLYRKKQGPSSTE